MRIVPVYLALVAASSIAAAQSGTSTNVTAAPANTPPSVTQPNGQKKAVIPPAARAGEKGLRVGDGAVTGEPIEIKRQK
ncbi:MAG: hypothetical protein E6G97_09740 [Alphaproteobacteria bacterium]|nr:MAG: hypothetical protein E6G97_09740 [Alphaproteobacteria bacterium]